MLKWGVERRLEFIEFRLFWEGVNRSDLIDTFGVSVPQASKDLTHYQERAPLNAIYDKSARRYVAGPEFQPVFLDPDPDAYLMRLRSMAEGFAEPVRTGFRPRLIWISLLHCDVRSILKFCVQFWRQCEMKGRSSFTTNP